MSQHLPTGFPVDGWTPRPAPPKTPMTGTYCEVVPLDPQSHSRDLHRANLERADQDIWTYLAYGPFDSHDSYLEWLVDFCAKDDPMFHAVIHPEHGAVGVASYLRMQPGIGTIEVGHINFSPRLQNTRAGTEAMFLMMRRVFDELGYRRYEWKCDALNENSRKAAERLGFTYEGTFRQATIYKNRNRDTAWYSIIDAEWAPLRQAYEIWLAEENFDSQGRQIQSLSSLTSNR